MMEGISPEAASIAGHLGLGAPRLRLRRQPHHDRRHDLALVHDGGQGQALRGLRLARPARRRLRGPGRAARRARGGEGRGGAPVADRPAQPHRLPGAARDRHRQGARRARSARPRCGRRRRSMGFDPDATLRRLRRRARAHGGRRRARRRAAARVGRRASPPGRGASRSWRAERELDLPRRAARRLARGAARVPGRRGGRDARCRPQGDAGAEAVHADDGRRRRRPRRVDQDRVRGRRRLLRDARRPQHRLRDPRARDGLDRQRDRARAGDAPALRLDVPDLLRLHAPGRAAVRADGAARRRGSGRTTRSRVGEDGPTHQPVEHHMALRAIPNLWYVRPADANETSMAWRIALERPGRPRRARADAPEAADLRPHRGRPGERRAARRLHAVAARRGRARRDRDRDRQRGAPGARGGAVARGQRARRLDAVLGALRGAGRRLPGGGAAARRRARVAVEAGVTLGWERYRERDRSASTISAHRRRTSGSSPSSGSPPRRSPPRSRPSCSEGRRGLRSPRRQAARRRAGGDRGCRARRRSTSAPTPTRCASTTPTRRSSSGWRSAAARSSAACSSAAPASARRSRRRRSPASAPRSATTRTRRTRESSTTT